MIALLSPVSTLHQAQRITLFFALKIYLDLITIKKICAKSQTKNNE